MVKLANILLNTFHFKFSGDNLLFIELDQVSNFNEIIENFVFASMPSEYVIREEDLKQIREDLTVFIIRELAKRTHHYIMSLEEEDCKDLKRDTKGYFIYSEDE